MKKNFSAPVIQVKSFGRHSIMTLSGVEEGTNAAAALTAMTSGSDSVSQENITTLLLK